MVWLLESQSSMKNPTKIQVRNSLLAQIRKHYRALLDAEKAVEKTSEAVQINKMRAAERDLKLHFSRLPEYEEGMDARRFAESLCRKNPNPKFLSTQRSFLK